MADWFAETALSGNLLLAVPVVAIAGLVSFFSPCVVPLLPGYLSYVSGVAVTDVTDETGARRGRMFAGASLFVLGFSAVFVTEGALFGYLGMRLLEYQRTLSIVMGAIVIVLGFAFIGFVPLLQRQMRIRSVPAVGVAVAPLLGVFFAVGWIPCIGPTLGAVLTLSSTGQDATAARGAVLALFYCLGLGIPFLVAAIGFSKMMRAVGWFRRHQRAITYTGGGLLIIVGVLLVSGAWDSIAWQMRDWIGGTGAVL